MRFLYFLFLMFIFFQCSLSKKVEKEQKISEKGIYLFYGNSDEFMIDIFVEGDFSKKSFIAKLRSKDTLFGELIPISKSAFYNFESKGLIIKDADNNRMSTHDIRDVSVMKAKIKVKKAYLGEEFYDPTNPYLIFKMRLNEDDDLIIKYKQTYDQLLSVKLLAW